LGGRDAEARQVAELMLAESRNRYVSPVAVASVYATAGDADRAFALLERAYEEHDESINALKVEPSLDTLRRDPRFQTLARRFE
jgi:hypothetical protein